MQKLKKIFAIVLFVVAIAVELTACNQTIETPTVSDHYDTQNRLSAVEYAAYIGKQINVFANQLNTRIIAVQNGGTGAETAELALAQHSYDVMKTARDEVYVTYPSVGSDKDREAVLTAMDTALNDMQSYITALKSKTDVIKYKKIFENDFNELTGLFSLYYQ